MSECDMPLFDHISFLFPAAPTKLYIRIKQFLHGRRVDGDGDIHILMLMLMLMVHMVGVCKKVVCMHVSLFWFYFRELCCLFMCG